jgi:hypothetical protein
MVHSHDWVKREVRHTSVDICVSTDADWDGELTANHSVLHFLRTPNQIGELRMRLFVHENWEEEIRADFLKGVGSQSQELERLRGRLPSCSATMSGVTE